MYTADELEIRCALAGSPRAEQLIACLEGEIAKRDEELAACRVAVENCELFRARIAELEQDLAYFPSTVRLLAETLTEREAEINQLRAELSAIKAQDTVGEVVGWYRLDRPYEMTHYPSVCATWHRLGAPVAPLYAAPAAPAADALLVEALDYQVLFDAIAAATSVYANGAVNISVQAFRDALAAHRAKEGE